MPDDGATTSCQTYSVREAATMLGVGAQTMYDAIKRGEVPNAGIGDKKRIPKWWIEQRLGSPQLSKANAPTMRKEPRRPGRSIWGEGGGARRPATFGSGYWRQALRAAGPCHIL